MEESQQSSLIRSNLLIILIAAATQGWALFGLYHAIKNNHWPAPDSAWLAALYALAVFVPTTVQLLAEHSRKPALWCYIGAIAAILFYFGWHHGEAVATVNHNNNDLFFPLGFIVAIFWLILLPFVQSRLTSGTWSIDYSQLFSSAWRNKLMLAEAGLFTGLFWLLLMLWQTLFHMLGIDYFRELFAEPIFAFPVTSITFGIALYLIGSIDRWTTIVLEQILNVLKWLATVAAVILILFTIALLFKLPEMIATGQKAIGAAWLLWLVAVMVLLLNAAYRDGHVERPYPTWLARPLQWSVPLTVVIALTALYALSIRTQNYGLTVERIWAFIVAGTALIYVIGYSSSAFSHSSWLPSIARVNVIAAITLLLVIGAALTPILSPYRLAADSQFQMALNHADMIKQSKKSTSATGPCDNATEFVDVRQSRHSPHHYLRFDAGLYGQNKLQELAKVQNHPRKEQIRARAQAALAQKNRWSSEQLIAPDIAGIIAALPVHPSSRSIDTNLRDALQADLQKPQWDYPFNDPSAEKFVGIFIDLNGDATTEFVLQTDNNGRIYQQQDGQWRLVARSNASNRATSCKSIIQQIQAEGVLARAPVWRDLAIGDRVYRLEAAN